MLATLLHLKYLAKTARFTALLSQINEYFLLMPYRIFSYYRYRLLVISGLHITLHTVLHHILPNHPSILRKQLHNVVWLFVGAATDCGSQFVGSVRYPGFCPPHPLPVDGATLSYLHLAPNNYRNLCHRI